MAATASGVEAATGAEVREPEVGDVGDVAPPGPKLGLVGDVAPPGPEGEVGTGPKPVLGLLGNMASADAAAATRAPKLRVICFRSMVGYCVREEKLNYMAVSAVGVGKEKLGKGRFTGF